MATSAGISPTHLPSLDVCQRTSHKKESCCFREDLQARQRFFFDLEHLSPRRVSELTGKYGQPNDYLKLMGKNDSGKHVMYLYMFMINLKCVKNPTVLLETNTTGNKFPNAFLTSLNASQRKSSTAREDFTKISWAVDVLDALQLRGNNANHMFAYIFEIIILRACENMDNVHKNTQSAEYGLSWQ